METCLRAFTQPNHISFERKVCIVNKAWEIEISFISFQLEQGIFELDLKNVVNLKNGVWLLEF